MEFNIEPYKIRTEVIRQTAEQIKLDFGRFGMDITFSGNTEMAYDELFSQLKQHISVLVETNLAKLKALLYQIDVSQQQIHDRMIEYREQSEENIISDLIIRRELKKVITRNYYRIHKKI